MFICLYVHLCVCGHACVLLYVSVGTCPCRRAWQRTPVFLPGESPWTKELAWRSPRGHKESYMTERLSTAQRSLGTCVPVCVLLCVFCVYPCVCEWTGASCLDTYGSPWPAALCLSFHTVEMPCAFQRIRWSDLSALHMSLNQPPRRRFPPDALALSGWPACPCPCSSANWVGP